MKGRISSNNRNSVQVLSITIFLVWLTCVFSSSLPVEKNESVVEESSSNTEGLGTDPKFNSYIKNKPGWPKNTKKPIFGAKSKLKSEHVSQGELKDSYRKPAGMKKLSPDDIDDSTLVAPSPYAPVQNKTKLLLTCANDDEEMQQVCENFCTQVKSFDLGFCSADQQTCVCAMEGDDLTTLRVKLLKSQSQENSVSEEENSEIIERETEDEAYLSREEFACDQTDYAERVCSAYCFQFRELNVSKCSEDGKACLCYSNEEQMKQIGENVEREDGARTGRHLEDIDDMFLGLGPPRIEKKPVFVKGRVPLVAPPPHHHGHHPLGGRGCSYHSCIHECPGYCQSMCMHSVDCYCSCPEDLYYTYEDEYPFFTPYY